jgi:nucleoside-diphosphate kinase
MSVQQTLILIKPDAMKRHLMGPVLTKLEEAKSQLVAAKLVLVSEKLANEHYKDHVGKPFFTQLVEYITGKLHGNTPVMALVYRGDDSIQKIRNLSGNTNPEKAEMDTVRGSFGRITTAGVFENVLHASANPAEAEYEINLWFKPEEILK